MFFLVIDSINNEVHESGAVCRKISKLGVCDKLSFNFYRMVLIKLSLIKLFRKVLFPIVCLVIFQSCNSSESYLLTYQSKLRIIERQDHQKCISQGLDYGEWDEITTEMYWRCRYNLINERKINDAITAVAIRNNAAIEKISEEILKNLNRAKYSALAKIEDDIELSDHKKCESRNYGLGIGGLNDDYYRCRQDLIVARIPPAPRITHLFETSILPDDRAAEYKAIADSEGKSNQEVNLIVDAMQKYPNCLGLNVKSNDFKKCSAATDESQRCLANVNSLQVKKELQDKIYCQQQAFLQFPDNYALAKDKSAGEIEKLKIAEKSTADQEVKKENNATLAYLESDKNIENIGRYVEDVSNQEEQSKGKIYSRIELLKLRERFIYQCDKKMEDKLPEFNKQSSQDCLDIAKNWDK